ncbi:hypothetical protein HK405_008194, partial [Cladochytrium tenue]
GGGSGARKAYVTEGLVDYVSLMNARNPKRLLEAHSATAGKVLAPTPRRPLGKSANFASVTADGHIPDTRVTRLANGFTVATETNPNFQTATVGVWIDAGSRFESEKTNGAAHFLEHMAFKGTKTRSQVMLETMIENIGGHLNAYTSREQTVYYAKALSKDVPLSVEILADILQRSILSEGAIERERGVILREAEEVDKQKEEVVFDHLHAAAFAGNALGRTILGPKENIESLTRADLANYIETNYTPDRMVLAAAGGVDHEALVRLAEQHFGSLRLPADESAKTLARPRFTGSEVRVRADDHPTAHVALAVEGVGWTSEDYWPLLIAQSVIGSWDRSLGAVPAAASPFAVEVARDGLASSFMSFNTSYTDTGLFGVYAVAEATPTSGGSGGSEQKLAGLVSAVQREWRRLAAPGGATAAEVARAKTQLRTSMLLSLDGTTPVAEDIGRQMLVYGRRLTPWEMEALIDGVTPEDVARVAAKYMVGTEVCVVGYGPIDGLPPYEEVKK